MPRLLDAKAHGKFLFTAVLVSRQNGYGWPSVQAVKVAYSRLFPEESLTAARVQRRLYRLKVGDFGRVVYLDSGENAEKLSSELITRPEEAKIALGALWLYRRTAEPTPQSQILDFAAELGLDRQDSEGVIARLGRGRKPYLRSPGRNSSRSILEPMGRLALEETYLCLLVGKQGEADIRGALDRLRPVTHLEKLAERAVEVELVHP